MGELIKRYEIMLGDCMELMKEIPDGRVDMIMCDLPYGTTACKWDSVIPFKPLWNEYRRVCKDNAAIVLMGSQPFTSALVMSNIGDYRCSWVWAKGKSGNFAIAKTQPLRVTEDVLVFSRGRNTYNPQMTPAKKGNMRSRNKAYKQRNGGMLHEISSGTFVCSESHREDLRYPTSILEFKSTEGECNNTNRVHPTQKPVALMEYLIRTYTNENEIVLDNCMGSGTTGVACAKSNRRFIGIERDETYFNFAFERIDKAFLDKDTSKDDNNVGENR